MILFVGDRPRDDSVRGGSPRDDSVRGGPPRDDSVRGGSSCHDSVRGATGGDCFRQTGFQSHLDATGF